LVQITTNIHSSKETKISRARKRQTREKQREKERKIWKARNIELALGSRNEKEQPNQQLGAKHQHLKLAISLNGMLGMALSRCCSPFLLLMFEILKPSKTLDIYNCCL
jgi:hypothetical protein